MKKNFQKTFILAFQKTLISAFEVIVQLPEYTITHNGEKSETKIKKITHSVHITTHMNVTDQDLNHELVKIKKGIRESRYICVNLSLKILFIKIRSIFIRYLQFYMSAIFPSFFYALSIYQSGKERTRLCVERICLDNRRPHLPRQPKRPP